MTRFGIFGGTFAPVHLGHMRAANAFLHACALDELRIIPTAQPPHKAMPTEVSASDRLAMLRLALAECIPDRRVMADDYEIRRGGYSYTYQTLEHFSSPDRSLWFLCGTDMFLTLDQWKHPERIFALAHIAYVLRAQADDATTARLLTCAERYRRDFGANILQIDADPIEISSTALRRAIAEGDADSVYLPRSVQHYIRTHRLFLQEAP